MAKPSDVAMSIRYALKHAAAVGASAALLSLSCHALVVNSNLFIAGDGFSLEDALSDARSQRTASDPPNYQVLVVGPEVKRLLRARASQRSIQQLQAASLAGAVFSVCHKDLLSLGLKPADLLPGIHIVQGYPAPAVHTALDEGEQYPRSSADRRMKSICSG